MTTPEGRVKQLVKQLFKQYDVYYFMPVQGGRGAAGLDFHATHHGYSIYVETKAPGKTLTHRQRATVDAILRASGAVYVVDGQESLKPVRGWLDAICDKHQCGEHLQPPTEQKSVIRYSEEDIP